MVDVFPGPSRLRHAAWSPDGTRLAAVFTAGHVWVYQPGSARPVLQLPSSLEVWNRATWSPGGETLATLAPHGLGLWDSATGRPLALFQSPGYLVTASWSNDGKAVQAALITGERPRQILAFASCSPIAGLWTTFHEEPAGVCGHLAFSADGRLLALSRHNGSLEVWDLKAGSRMAAVHGGGRRVSSVALAPERSILAVAFQGDLELWDLRQEKRLPALWAGPSAYYSLAFSPGGEVLAGKCEDGWVRFWWCEDWLPAVEIEESSPPGEQPELAFHPADPRLATAARGNTGARVWSLDLERISRERKRTTKKRVLFLSADSSPWLPRLRIDHELKVVQQALDRSRFWDAFEMRFEPAVSPMDISRALHDFEPQIVHFSGHGNPSGLIVEELGGGEHHIPVGALRDLLALAPHTECVVLNACDSQAEARAVSEVVQHVVGMTRGVEDRAAIAFSFGFYQALGFGNSYQEAYQSGCAQIGMDSPDQKDVPVFYRNGSLAPPGLVRGWGIGHHA